MPETGRFPVPETDAEEENDMTDRQAILAACEERTGDLTQLLVAADWMAENGDLKWETALRWLAKWAKRPEFSPTSRNWLWTCFGGLCGPTFDCGTNHALPRRLCNRMGFWEWRCYASWTEAVEALATALADGDVECVGDPTECEPEMLTDIRERTTKLLEWLRDLGVHIE